MKAVLASQSALKVEVCRSVLSKFYDNFDLLAVRAVSGVADQPLNDETAQGARNRIEDARNQIPDADLYISIENGLFEEQGKYVDRGFCLVQDNTLQEFIGLSEEVTFPFEAVQETIKRGFNKWTVGKVMQEMRLVTQHDDPHKDLSGKSRKEYLIDAISAALLKLKR